MEDRPDKPHVQEDQPAREPELKGLQEIQKTLEEAAAVSTPLWLSYVFVLFYMAVSAGAVTHLDLLLESAVKLPFLSVDLPLLAFFIIAPLLLLLVHAYILVHLVLTRNKALRFHRALYDSFPLEPEDARQVESGLSNEQCRENFREGLTTNIFVQFLTGPKRVRHSAFGLLLRFIAWMTIIVCPVLVLMEFQIQFLPYHHVRITWEHRAVLLIDLCLIWWLASKLFLHKSQARAVTLRLVTAGVLSTGALIFSFFLAVSPGEPQLFPPFTQMHDYLFNGELDPITHRRSSVLSNTLILPHLNAADALKVEDPQKVDWHNFLLSLRGRDLRGGVFTGSFMVHSDLSGADLRGAQLDDANLEGSFLYAADMRAAQLSSANLAGAYMYKADLDGAILVAASLKGVMLARANLAGIDMADSKADLANFNLVNAKGAKLSNVSFRGTSFNKADLQGADLRSADLRGTFIDETLLWRSVLTGARIEQHAGTPKWQPLYKGVGPWGPASYAELVKEVEGIPGGLSRSALDRIVNLDCSMPDHDMAPCRGSSVPATISTWQESIQGARVESGAYPAILADTYVDVICSSGKSGLSIFRALAGLREIEGAKILGKAFNDVTIAKLVSEKVIAEDCPISLLLTPSDKIALKEFIRGGSSSQPESHVAAPALSATPARKK